jgi:hypothetical protein
MSLYPSTMKASNRMKAMAMWMHTGTGTGMSRMTMSRGVYMMMSCIMLLLLSIAYVPLYVDAQTGCAIPGTGPYYGAPVGASTSCGGNTQSNGGGCWCDDACYTYQDCCPNYANICKVPYIAGISPPNGPTSGGTKITINGGAFSGQGTLKFYQPTSGK